MILVWLMGSLLAETVSLHQFCRQPQLAQCTAQYLVRNRLPLFV